MADHTAPLTGAPIGDPEIDAIFAEIDELLKEWDSLIDEQLATAERLRDLAAIEEEFNC